VGGLRKPVPGVALTDGAHRFEVRGRDVAGNIGPAAALNWEVQSGAPKTVINSGPSGLTSQRSTTVTFSSDKAGTFECDVDSAGWQACTSPLELSDLTEGAHTIRVRSISSVNPVGVKDPTPAQRSWTVDSVSPETTIDSAPTGSTESTTAQVTFSSDDPSAAFQCKLDDANYSSCSSPLNLSGLPTGLRTLLVRAIDPAGNADATPEEASWTITAPVVPTCPPGTQGTPPNCQELPPVVGDKLVSTLTGGTLSIAALGEVPLPAGQLIVTGALDKNGNWGVPQAGVNFLPIEQTIDAPGIGQVTVKISIQATGPGSGTLPNGGGAATFNLPVQAKLEASLGGIPLIGPDADCFLRPISFNLSGTYDEAGQTAIVGSPAVTFPTVSAGCGALGGTVNDLLELPRSDIAISLEFDLVKTVAPSGAPKLAKPFVMLARSLKSGKPMTVTTRIRNNGTTAASNVKVCFRAPANLVNGRSSACRTVPVIAVGRGVTVRQRFRTKPGRKGKRFRVVVSAGYKANGQNRSVKTIRATTLR
jgi:hypothetical protein